VNETGLLTLAGYEHPGVPGRSPTGGPLILRPHAGKRSGYPTRTRESRTADQV